MSKFEMVAKTLMGLEQVLAEELRALGAENVEPGRRMVSFYGDLEMMYKANLCCRTALRILKPFYKFTAHTPDELYDQAKDFDWSSILDVDKTFCIDTVAYSEDFTHSHFVTYRVKDAIVDWFRDKYGDGKRPGVRLKDADVMINVHIAGGNVTLSLDSSGESLHKRGYRVAQTEAPINEVLAAGIILLSGWRGGDIPFVDPMCGSGTFLIEAALIAANINPGIYRQSFAFQNWKDYDQELFEKLYYDDSQEREIGCNIYGADISPAAIEIASRNIRAARVGKYIDLKAMPIAQWTESPRPAGVLVTNPPYGERISVEDMEGLYAMIGNRLKNAFQGYHAWIIGYRDEYFQKIGLAPSQKIPMLNGALECELREYVIFEGDKKSFLASGGKLKDKTEGEEEERPRRRERRDDDRPRRERRDDDRPRRERRDDDRKAEGRTGWRKAADGDKPRRKFEDGDKPRRKFDDSDKPRRKFEDGDKPRRKFDEGDKPRRKFDDGDKPRRKFDDGDKPRRKFDDRPRREDESVSDNPLAKRRNPQALRMLMNKQPSLPAPDGPVMRKRKKDIEE